MRYDVGKADLKERRHLSEGEEVGMAAEPQLNSYDLS